MSNKMTYLESIKFLLGNKSKRLLPLVLIFLISSLIDLLGIGLIGGYIAIILDPLFIIKFQEMIFQYKPKILIEVGIAWGGLLLFLDSIKEKAKIKKIIGIDIFIPDSLKNRLNKKISKDVKI